MGGLACPVESLVAASAQPDLGSRPHVTIYIPTHDRVRFLADVLGSVLQQTYRSIRIVVVDNGSREDVAAAVAHYLDPRLTLHRYDDDRGFVGNLNRVIADADAPWFMVFHDDDTMHPRLVERMVDVIAAEPGLAFVASGYREVNSGDDMLSFEASPDERVERFAGPRDLARALVAHGALALGSCLYRSDAILESRLDGERYGSLADRPFLLEVASRGGCALLREAWMNYRLHASQVVREGRLTGAHVLALLQSYRDELAPFSSRHTHRSFLVYATNTAIASFSSLSPSNRGSLFSFFLEGWSAGLFRVTAVRRPAMAGIVRVLRDALHA